MEKRKAYRTVLDVLFHALVRYAAPIIPFTAEEVWKSRYPKADSVHMLDWPEVDGGWKDEELGQRWNRIRYIRSVVTAAVEPLRREKKIHSSLEAAVGLSLPLDERLQYDECELAEICIVSRISHVEEFPGSEQGETADAYPRKVNDHKCGRCWRHLPEVTEDGDLCNRCEDILA